MTKKVNKFIQGKYNAITDVPGVTVGHVTYSHGPIQTGVTAIKAHQGNHFQHKLPAAAHVINGFGKSAGLVQIMELGQLETPIILTNTLAVGTALQGLVDYMLLDNPHIGLTTGTVNGVVCECNDGYLNAIRSQTITQADVFEALHHTTVDFARGAVGAGRGMSCYELKGGIGSASRMIKLDDQTFAVGVLVLANFGKMTDLILDYQPIGQSIATTSNYQDQGSIIVVLATDIPLDSRQLTRVLKRTTAGIARTGSYIGNGSGEIAIGFSTQNKIPHYPETALISQTGVHEEMLDDIFALTVEVTESAIIDSLLCAETVIGRDGHMRESLKDKLT